MNYSMNCVKMFCFSQRRKNEQRAIFITQNSAKCRKNFSQTVDATRCCTLIKNGYKRDRLFSRAMRKIKILRVGFILIPRLCRFCRWNLWNDLNNFFHVFVMIFISYRQIYFRLLDSHILNRLIHWWTKTFFLHKIIFHVELRKSQRKAKRFCCSFR